MSQPSSHPLYSSDDHLDIMNVPRDLWSARLPARYRDAGPHVVEQDGTHLWMVGERPMGVSGRMDAAVTALSRVPDLEDDGFRPSDPKLRLEDMDRDGIRASIVYGPGALTGFPIADPELKRLVLRAWNDWSAEVFNSHAPGRLSALPFLPTTSPDDAASELERVAALGHRGAIINPFEMRVEDPAWDRLWAAAGASGLPLSFHIGGGTRLNPMLIRERAPFSSICPIQLDEPVALVIFTGVLERHPELRLVLAEAGVGWLPYFIGRMDAQFEKHCVPYPDECIRTRPSELWSRQIYATFEEEPLAEHTLPLLDADNLMWACDYPHPDSTWPHSREAVDHALGSLDPGAVRKITGETCRRLYRLD